MTIATTAPALSSAGISAPSYADILDYLKTQYRLIYGADIYLESDSQDGQFLAIVASAINDTNSAAIAVYNSFSPARAVGTSLSSNVKLNGLQRLVPTNSTANLSITGVAGTAIVNGIVQDAAKNNWALPATVNIPNTGQVTVTATCATAGAITAAPGVINTIITPQLGWQAASNPNAAVAGAPVESDAALRLRQAVSVAQPAQSPLVAVVGAVAAVAGVTRYTAYENPTSIVDANGLPAHSIALVTEGGAAASIATAIANKKTVGAATYGTTSQTVVDQYGIPRTINFFAVAAQRIKVDISLHPINGYTATIGAKIQAAIAAYINSIAIGQSLFITRLYSPANLVGDVDGLTYEITALGASIFPAATAPADVAIAFNQVAHCDLVDVVITLV